LGVRISLPLVGTFSDTVYCIYVCVCVYKNALRDALEFRSQYMLITYKGLKFR